METKQIKIGRLTINALSKGTNFHIRISKEEAEWLLKTYDMDDSIMCKEYGEGKNWVGVTQDDLNDETGKFDNDYKTFELFLYLDDKAQNVIDTLPDFIELLKVGDTVLVDATDRNPETKAKIQSFGKNKLRLIDNSGNTFKKHPGKITLLS